MVPPPDENIHGPIVSRLTRLLITELNRLGNPGQLFFPREGIWTYYPDTWLEPDLFYLSGESIVRYKDRPRSSADLVIEVISVSTADYDRFTKADSYAALGVQELWLVDPYTRQVEAKINEGNRWGTVTLFREGEEIGSGVIPGLRISVAAIFSE